MGSGATREPAIIVTVKEWDPSTQNHCRAFNPERGRSMSYEFQDFTIFSTNLRPVERR